jgi:hypothetical protein
MKVLILERNLMWSSRLAKLARSAGHEVELSGSTPENTDSMIAIINLGERSAVDIESLKEKGMKILAHAGHKEKALLEFGTKHRCDRVVSNSEIVNKLPMILTEMMDEG